MSKQTIKKANNTADDTTAPMLSRARKIKTIEDAKSLLSRLISALIKRTISGREAKDVTYLLSVYVKIHSDHDLEKRLEALEKRLDNNYGMTG